MSWRNFDKTGYCPETLLGMTPWYMYTRQVSPLFYKLQIPVITLEELHGIWLAGGLELRIMWLTQINELYYW